MFASLLAAAKVNEEKSKNVAIRVFWPFGGPKFVSGRVNPCVVSYILLGIHFPFSLRKKLIRTNNQKEGYNILIL